MTYQINKTNPFDGAVIPIEAFSSNGPDHPLSPMLSKSSARASTSLLLHGKGQPSYGEAIAKNMVHLLENFSGPVPPKFPINGQIWSCRLDYARTANGWWSWDMAKNIWILTDTKAGMPDSFVHGEMWVNNDTLRIAINAATHPLHNKAVEVKYIDAQDITDPNAAGMRPSVELLVYDNGRWLGTSDIIVGTVAPDRDSSGKLWYDTNVDTIKIFLNGTYVDILENYLSSTGGIMSGDIDMDFNTISNIKDPEDDSDAVNKTYLESALDTINPANNSFGVMKDVDLSAPPTDNQIIKWNDEDSTWKAGSIKLADVSDLHDTGIAVNEFSHLAGLKRNINTALRSIETALEDSVNKTGDALEGNLSFGNTYHIQNLPLPVDKRDAVSKEYVDNKLKHRHSTLSKTAPQIISSGLTPVDITQFNLKNDPYGIAILDGGIIDLARLADITPRVNVKITANAIWDSVDESAGIRSLQLVGVDNIFDIKTPIAGFQTTQYISTGIISVSNTCLLYTSPSPRDRG